MNSSYMLKNIEITLPALETEHLLIKPIDRNEMRSLIDNYAERELFSYSAMRRVESEQNSIDLMNRIDKLLKNIDIKLWGLYIKRTKQLIAVIGFTGLTMQDKNANLCFEFDNSYSDNPILAEALNRILQFSFQVFGIRNIESLCPAGNIGLLQILEQSGMKYEYTIQQFDEDGGYHRVHRKYSLKRDDWMARNN